MEFETLELVFWKRYDHTATGTLSDSKILSSVSNFKGFLSLPIFTYSSYRSFKSSGRFVDACHPKMSFAALGSA